MGDPERPGSEKLLYGVAAIAEYLGLAERQARHQIEKGRIPTFRMGAIICAYPAKLDAWLEQVSAGDAAREPRRASYRAQRGGVSGGDKLCH